MIDEITKYGHTIYSDGTVSKVTVIRCENKYEFMALMKKAFQTLDSRIQVTGDLDKLQIRKTMFVNYLELEGEEE
tara:strand:- start:4836 stop:5060 length:225 start_codon:yes stop_codon:yes gene_type:complete